MPETSFNPVPYYQFAPSAKSFDYSNCQYTFLPNQRIRNHYPFVKIDLNLLEKAELDIAVAVAVVESEGELATGLAPVSNDDNTLSSSTPDVEKISLDILAVNDPTQPDKKWTSCPVTSDEHIEKVKTQNQVSVDKIRTDNLLAAPTQTSEAQKLNIQTPDEPRLEDNAVHSTTSLNAASLNETLNSSDLEVINPQSFKTLSPPKISKSTNTTDAKEDLEEVSLHELINSDELTLENQSTEDTHDLNQEEKALQKKEAQLESYKQFVAEQKIKVEIDYPEIRVSIEANALPSRMYFTMNALSAIIASYGLVINSAAVVIGAMLVAMMLGPISGVALAIIDYRMPFLRKSLLTVFAGGSMVVIIGFIIGLMHDDMALSSEILSRTQPTSMDLMIALAGGTAGAYAMISPHLSVAVVGVAVATALVPPLAASGILFAHGEGSLGFGALLLAITNIIAIQFTNALVLWFSGFRRLIEQDYKTNTFLAFFRRNAVPVLLLASIGVYLSYNLNIITKKQNFENEVKETIRDYFSARGNVLTATQFTNKKDHHTVRAVIRGETRPSSYDAKLLENIILEHMETFYPTYPPVLIQLRYMPEVVIDSNPTIESNIDKTDVAILSNDE